MGALILLFVSQLVFAGSDDLTDFAPEFENTKYIKNGLFNNRPPDFDQLVKDQSQFHDSDSFLKYLIAKSPSLAKNYILVHNSESQQLSSLEEPRVLLFQGGIFYGLSNHPGQKDKRVEILEVDPKTSKVSLAEIIFTDKGPKFEKNPKSCVACHGVNSKPLWNPYDFWPNTFNSAIGFVSDKQESKAYENLVQKSTTHPILKHLTVPEKLSFDTEKVTDFTAAISFVNLGRWIQDNITEDNLGGYVAPLAATLSFCTGNQDFKIEPDKEGLAAFFREDEWKTLSSDYDKIKSDVVSGRAFFKKFLDQTLLRIFPNPERDYIVDHSRLARETITLAQMALIFKNAGIDTSNLSPSLIGNDILISAPTNFAIDFVTYLYILKPQLFKNINVLPESLGYQSTHWIKGDCNQLKQLSLATSREPSKNNFWKSYREVKDSRPVISRCAKCHVENQSAPYIPFDQPLKMAQWLKSGRAKISERIHMKGKGQMPPVTALSKQEIEALEAFMDVLN